MYCVISFGNEERCEGRREFRVQTILGNTVRNSVSVSVKIKHPVAQSDGTTGAAEGRC